MEQIGRGGWLFVGVVGLAVVGASRAIADVGHIVRDMARPELAGDPSRAAGPPQRTDSGRGGWVLLTGLILVGGAIYHLLAGFEAIVKDLLGGGPAGQAG